MATSSETYVGIDVSKDRLDVAALGKARVWQVDNTREGIVRLVQWMQELQPELIVVEATGGYQRAAVEAVILGRLGSSSGESCSRETICACLWALGQDR
jgi:hypothetical protein